MNIYVGNLPFTVTEDEVRELFEAYGTVTAVSLIKDRDTQKMRGFGFVEMANDPEAQEAIQALNGKEFNRRSLVVNEARPREDRGGGRRPGGGGGRGSFERRNRDRGDY